MSKVFLKQLQTEIFLPLAIFSLLFGVAAWWPLGGMVSPRSGAQDLSPTQNTAIITDNAPPAGGMRVVK
jgi:hypothetical protein